MIEIIGTRSSEEKEPEWRSLPKNVRQIGESRERRKIYMEDYVVTYLARLSKPNQAYARGAILFGKLYETEEGPAIFINGAVEAGNLELDMDETVFNDLIWDELIEKGKKYFPDQEVAGWFLSRMGFSVEMNQKIMNTHLKNFSGEHKVLYMIDSLEKEDAIYLCENRQLKRQRGYYIYYEKNTAMQEYMLDSDDKSGKTSEEHSQKSELRRDRKIVNSYRKMSQYSRNTKKQDIRIRMIRTASAFLIVIMGIYITGRLGERFADAGWQEAAVTTFRTVKNVFSPEEESQVVEEIRTGEGRNEEEETVTVFYEGNLEEEDRTEDSADNLIEMNGEEDGGQEAVQETIEQPKPLYYIVQKGDTLAAISRKMYSSDKYTEQIAKANELSNADEIYEGQKILIPSME